MMLLAEKADQSRNITATVDQKKISDIASLWNNTTGIIRSSRGFNSEFVKLKIKPRLTARS